MLLGRLKKQGVAMHTRTRVTGLTKHNALVDKDDSPVRFPIETVIMAVGVRPDRSLAEALGTPSRPEKHWKQSRRALKSGWSCRAAKGG